MPASASYSTVPSFWAATANPHPALGHLTEDIDTDVAIIGGGFTGLTTAHYLHKSGIGCVVLEANDAGWGASGRNGGQGQSLSAGQFHGVCSLFWRHVTQAPEGGK